MMNMPTPVPTFTIPLIIPRFFRNHLDTVDKGITSIPPSPTDAIRPQNKYNCHMELSVPIRRNPTPRNRLQADIMSRGPNLSLRLPRTILDMPCTRNPNEAAPEIVALDQPNSFIKGSKKTPKLLLMPQTTACIKKPAAIIMQP